MIAAVHAEAKSSDHTDWAQIAALYGLLLRINPSPVIELNRAVAVAMSEGPESGLKQIKAILDNLLIKKEFTHEVYDVYDSHRLSTRNTR